MYENGNGSDLCVVGVAGRAELISVISWVVQWESRASSWAAGRVAQTTQIALAVQSHWSVQ